MRAELQSPSLAGRPRNIQIWVCILNFISSLSYSLLDSQAHNHMQP